jgi:hypothetical protein
LIGFALRGARRVGFGLPLVNEMVTELEGVPRDMIGQAVHTAYAGFQAAQAFQAAGPNALPDLDSLPVVPSAFADDFPGSRIVGMSDLQFTTGDKDTLQEWGMFWGGDEDDRRSTIYQMQEEQLDEALDEYDELLKELKQIIGVNLIFMGKRF